MRRILKAIALCLSLWLPPALASVPVAPVEVDAGMRVLDLNPRLEVFEDKSGTLDLDRVRAANDFKPVPATGLKIGFSNSAWWVRFRLANRGTDARELVLREAYPLMDNITLYAPQADGRWSVTRTGDRLPFHTREYDHRDFLFALVLPPTAGQDYYVRFASDGPIDIALRLYEPRALLGVLSMEQLAYGAYFGGFLVLVLYNLSIFLVVRDHAFFYYLLYAISYGLYFSVFNGLSFQFLWPDKPAWANMSLLVLLSSTLIFGMHFTRRFLDTRVYSPRLDRFALGLQALALLCFVLSFFLPYSELIRPLAMLTVVVTATIMTLGTIGLIKGYKPARYFMVGWGLLLVGVLMNMLKNFGLLPHNVLTQNGFQIGSLCEMVLLSLALASRVNEMQRQSRTDALTKLFNRRFFDERIAFEFERAQHFRQPLSLLVVDIDHFKAFNDQHGHSRGDEVLRTVARQLLDGVRDQDIVCRYGGEEFVLILPGASGDQAMQVAESLRYAIEQSKVHGAESITISVGVASPGDGDLADVGALFRAADAALYQAKAAGRNRVVRHRD